MYLATSMRLDIELAVGLPSRFVSHPSGKNIGAVKRVFRYLASTLAYRLSYKRHDGSESRIVVEGFSDIDWGGDPDSRRSVTRVGFTIAGGAVSWLSRFQSVVAMSTAEAEYIASCEAAIEAASLRKVIEETLNVTNKSIAVKIGVDKSSAMTLTMDPTFSRWTWHIELRWHYVREQGKKRKFKCIRSRRLKTLQIFLRNQSVQDSALDATHRTCGWIHISQVIENRQATTKCIDCA